MPVGRGRARAQFTLGADHSGALCNAAQSLAQIAAPAHEGDLEVVLVDVVRIVCRSQNLHAKQQQQVESNFGIYRIRICSSTSGHMESLLIGHWTVEPVGL